MKNICTSQTPYFANRTNGSKLGNLNLQILNYNLFYSKNPKIQTLKPQISITTPVLQTLNSKVLVLYYNDYGL